MWVKPPEMVAEEAAKAAAPADLGPPKPTSGNGWREYTAPDGRKYYHKAATNTTQWTRPAEMDEPPPADAGAAAAAAEVAGEQGGGSLANGQAGAGKAEAEDAPKKEQPKKEKKPKPEPVPDLPAKKYDSKEEAMADFKELLEDKITSHKTPWDEAVKELQGDVRFKALKSAGEKKNVFQSFMARKQREFVEAERVRKKQAKVDFQTLLTEVPLNEGDQPITHQSRYRDMQEQLSKDPRFGRLDSDRERADLFEDFVMELEKKEKERLRAARGENLAAFRVLLSEIPELTSKTRWSEVKLMVKDDERYLALEGDDKYRLEAFDDFMVQLARKEAEERELLKDKKRAQEKEQRAAFVLFLTEFGDKGLITALTQWREFRDSDDAKADARFKDMLEQSKTKAQDMFEDFTEELHAKYQADRPVLKAAYKAAEKVDITSCGLEAFAAAVRAHPPCADVADGHVALFYQELVKLAQEELEKKERRRVRAEKDFRRLVKKYVDRGKLQPTASYEDAVAVCGERSAWKDVAEAVRRELFAKLLEDIAKGADDEEEERSRCLTPPPSTVNPRPIPGLLPSHICLSVCLSIHPRIQP